MNDLQYTNIIKDIDLKLLELSIILDEVSIMFNRTRKLHVKKTLYKRIYYIMKTQNMLLNEKNYILIKKLKYLISI